MPSPTSPSSSMTRPIHWHDNKERDAGRPIAITMTTTITPRPRPTSTPDDDDDDDAEAKANLHAVQQFAPIIGTDETQTNAIRGGLRVRHQSSKRASLRRGSQGGRNNYNDEYKYNEDEDDRHHHADAQIPIGAIGVQSVRIARDDGDGGGRGKWFGERRGWSSAEDEDVHRS